MADIKDRYELDVSGLLDSINKVKAGFNSLETEVSELKATNKEAFAESGKAVEQTSNAFDGLGDSIGSSITELGILQGGTAKTIAILKAKIGALNGVRNAFLVASKGAGFFRAALISTGIGAIVVVIGALINSLSRTQAVLNVFKSIGAAAGAVFERFGDIIAGIGSVVVSFFQDPLEGAKSILEGLVDFIVGQFTNRIDGLIQLFKSLGKGIEALVTLDFEALKEAASEAGEGLVKVTTGVTPETFQALGEGVKDFAGSIADAATEAYNLEQALNALEERRVAFIVREAELLRDIAVNRELISDAEASIEEKQAAINENRKLEQELTDELISQAKERLRIEAAKLALNESDLAAQEEVAKLNAELIKLEADSANRKRALNKEERKINNEVKRRNEEFKKQQEEQRKKALEIKKAYEDILKSVTEAVKSAELENLIGSDRIIAEKNIAIQAIDELEAKTREAAKAAGQAFSGEEFAKLRILAEQKAQAELDKLTNQQTLDRIDKEKERAKLVAELLDVSTDDLLTLEEQRQALLLENDRLAISKRLEEQTRYYTEIGTIQDEAVQNELELLRLNIQKIEKSESELREAARLRVLDQRLKSLDDQTKIAEAEINLLRESGDATLTLQQFKERELLRIRKEASIQELALLEERFGPDSQQAKLARIGIESLNQQIEDALSKSLNPFDKLSDFLKDALQIDDEQIQAIKDTLSAVVGSVGDFISTNTDLAIEENRRLLDEIRSRISETESILKEEEERAAAGYSNNVENKRKELEELKRLEAQKVAEEQRLKQEALKQQLIADTAAQASNIVTSVSGILASAGKLGPILGPILAAAGILSIISLFRRYKSDAKNLASQKAYKGGSLSNYMGDRDSGPVAPGASSDLPGRGNGLRVEGTNLRIGGDEYLVRASSAKKYADILPQINAGTYRPRMDIFTPKMAAPKSVKKTYRILQQESSYYALRSLLNEHSDKLITYDKNKVEKIAVGDRLIEIRNGKTKITKL
jgi:hypothetical protein